MRECELNIDYLECGMVVNRTQAVGFISGEWIHVKIGNKCISVRKVDTISPRNCKSVFEKAILRTMIVDSKTGLKDKRIHPFDDVSDKGNLSERIDAYINQRLSDLANS